MEKNQSAENNTMQKLNQYCEGLEYFFTLYGWAPSDYGWDDKKEIVDSIKRDLMITGNLEPMEEVFEEMWEMGVKYFDRFGSCYSDTNKQIADAFQGKETDLDTVLDRALEQQQEFMEYAEQTDVQGPAMDRYVDNNQYLGILKENFVTDIINFVYGSNPSSLEYDRPYEGDHSDPYSVYGAIMDMIGGAVWEHNIDYLDRMLTEIIECGDAYSVEKAKLFLETCRDYFGAVGKYGKTDAAEKCIFKILNEYGKRKTAIEERYPETGPYYKKEIDRLRLRKNVSAKVHLFCLELDNFFGKYAPVPFGYDEGGRRAMVNSIKSELLVSTDRGFIEDTLLDIMVSGNRETRKMARFYMQLCDAVTEKYYNYDTGLEDILDDALKEIKSHNHDFYAIEEVKAKYWEPLETDYRIVFLDYDGKITPVDKWIYSDMEECRRYIPGAEVPLGELRQMKEHMDIKMQELGRGLCYDEAKAENRSFLQELKREAFIKEPAESQASGSAREVMAVKENGQKQSPAPGSQPGHKNLKSEIARDLKIQGLRPTRSLIKNMESLSRMRGKTCTLEDVRSICREKSAGRRPVRETAEKIAEECRKQELMKRRSCVPER